MRKDIGCREKRDATSVGGYKPSFSLKICSKKLLHGTFSDGIKRAWTKKCFLIFIPVTIIAVSFPAWASEV
jgi:hypothetical protein